MFVSPGVLDCPAVCAGFPFWGWLSCARRAATVAISPISTLGGATMSPVQLPVDVPVGSSSKLKE